MVRLHLGLLSMILFLSCGKSKIDRIEGPILSEGWRYENILLFDLRKSANEDVLIEVDHSTTYPFENLYIRLGWTENPSSSQPLSIPLADDKGYWKGDCSSQKCVYQYVISSSNEELATTLTIEQYSRDSILADINQINVLTRPKPKK